AVGEVALDPLGGVRAHVELEHTVAQLGREGGGAEEIRLEIQEDGRRGDVPLFVDMEEEQVDLQEGEEPRLEVANDVEDGQRRECGLAVLDLVEEVGGDFLDANAAVLVRVVEGEIDVGEQAPPDAAAGDGEIELGRGPQPCVEGELRRDLAV